MAKHQISLLEDDTVSTAEANLISQILKSPSLEELKINSFLLCPSYNS